MNTESQAQMMRYHQMILEKVSFSSELFEYELHKALRSLPIEQSRELIRWVDVNFDRRATTPRPAHRDTVAV